MLAWSGSAPPAQPVPPQLRSAVTAAVVLGRRADTHLHSPDVLGCPTPASPECSHHIVDLSLGHTFG